MLRLLQNTTFSTAVHRTCGIIKNVRTIFETLDTQPLDALCDVNAEGKLYQAEVLKIALEKLHLTRIIVIKYAFMQSLFKNDMIPAIS